MVSVLHGEGNDEGPFLLVLVGGPWFMTSIFYLLSRIRIRRHASWAPLVVTEKPQNVVNLGGRPLKVPIAVRL
jgi:hypothetical protein